jgi:hypothetical protein
VIADAALATPGVCTIFVVLVVLVDSQPAAFPTTSTVAPPRTAATTATTASDPGRISAEL